MTGDITKRIVWTHCNAERISTCSDSSIQGARCHIDYRNGIRMRVAAEGLRTGMINSYRASQIVEGYYRNHRPGISIELQNFIGTSSDIDIDENIVSIRGYSKIEWGLSTELI